MSSHNLVSSASHSSGYSYIPFPDLDLPSALQEISRVEKTMQTCQYQMATDSLLDPVRTLETCKTAILNIQRTLEGLRNKKIDRKLRILQTNYEFMREYIHRITPASTPSVSTEAPKKETIVTVERSPPSRSYLSFPKTVCSLAPAHPSSYDSLLELEEMLDKLDLLHPLQATIKKGESPEICFPFSAYELTWLVIKYPPLQALLPFIDRSKLTSFKGLDQVLSPKGLYEKVTENTCVVHSLIAEANSYFSHLKTPPVKCTIPPEALNSDRLLLEEIYKKQRFKGLCIGESHGDLNPTKFIIDNMEFLKELGIKTLFLEALFYDTMQPLLDAYFRDPSDEMPLILQNHLKLLYLQGRGMQPRRPEALDKHESLTHSYTVEALVRRAKAAGIRLVGIDTSAAFQVSATTIPEDRARAMNFVAEKIIRHETQDDGLFIALMGSWHCSSYPYPFPGIADLLQCPYMRIEGMESVERMCISRGYNGSHVYLREKKIHPPFATNPKLQSAYIS